MRHISALLATRCAVSTSVGVQASTRRTLLDLIVVGRNGCELALFRGHRHEGGENLLNLHPIAIGALYRLGVVILDAHMNRKRPITIPAIIGVTWHHLPSQKCLFRATFE